MSDKSANGNVVLFLTYDPLVLTQYGTPSSTLLHAYTLDSANPLTYPDTSITIDGLEMSPRLSGVSNQGYDFSDDGQLLFNQQWWEGVDTVVETRRARWALLCGIRLLVNGRFVARQRI